MFYCDASGFRFDVIQDGTLKITATKSTGRWKDI